MSDDFLEQLKNRPKVPQRTDELFLTPVRESVNPDTEVQGIQTTRSSILLEESMHNKFKEWCDKGGIIRACWLEAAMIVAEANPDLLAKIEALAKERTLQRKDTADDRRRVTMYQNRKK